jgi:hypothetical protein
LVGLLSPTAAFRDQYPNDVPIDMAVARRCAALHVPGSRPHSDALIAAAAPVHNLKPATRSVDDFKEPGIKVIDPWD